MGSDVEMESEDEREERKNKEKKRDRSRSRSKDRGDKKKHKKHKKEKKKHRKRDRDSDEGGDTGNEGGDTPEKAKARDGTPEPKNEEGDIDEKREKRREYNRDRSPEKKHDRKEYNRDRDDGDRRRRRSRSRSRDRHRDRSGSRERKEGRENYKREEKKEKNVEKNGDTEAEKPAEGGAAGGNAVISLSIEETNKLRAKLGLKPLNIEKKDEVDEHSDQPGVLIPGDRDKTRHLAPEHWGERDRAKKLREKLTTNKDKRTQNRKLMVVKGLGESDSEDDDASKWIERQKNKTKLKEEAEKRAKAMEQLDEEFGVGDIVEEGVKNKRQQEYTGSNLKGLRVEHSAEEFKESTTVLTLK